LCEKYRIAFNKGGKMDEEEKDEEQEEDVCDICGESDCPCPLCHGDPKRYMGASHGGIPQRGSDGFPTGEIECDECGTIS
jgi:hypothetical protein